MINIFSKKKNNEVKNKLKIEQMGLKQKLGKYEINFPDCSLNFSKIKIFNDKNSIEYEYRGSSEYIDMRVGSRAVRYLYGMRIRHFGNLDFDKQKGIPRNKYMTFIQYRGMSDGFETEYEIKKHSIKNTIVIPGNTNVNEFVYLFKTTNLRPYITYNKKSINFTNQKNKTIISLLNPYLYDSIGNYCENVFYEIKQYAENNYCILIKIDLQWLDSIERLRPIYLIFPMTF